MTASDGAMFGRNAGMPEGNRPLGRHVDVLGIVTNGEGWKFYRLQDTGEVWESLLYGIGEMSRLLGILRAVFPQCVPQL